MTTLVAHPSISTSKFSSTMLLVRPVTEYMRFVRFFFIIDNYLDGRLREGDVL